LGFNVLLLDDDDGGGVTRGLALTAGNPLSTYFQDNNAFIKRFYSQRFARLQLVR
jgi:hypothetical protein